MLVPVRLTPLLGLCLAALPVLAMGSFGLAFPPFVGGGAEVWRMAGAAGLYSLMMGLGIVGVTGVLSTLLCRGSSGRHAPLVLLVGLATLPWLLGIAGTQEALRRVLAALPEMGGPDALTMLATGTGEAMMTRLVGAWTSAALLLAVALGLVLLYRQARREARPSEGMLGAALALALATTALIAAFEAHLLVELFVPSAAPASVLPGDLFVSTTRRLTELHMVRSGLLGALALLGLAIVGWQFFPRPEAAAQWGGSLALVAIAATVLVLDARPLQLAARSAWKAEGAHGLLPSRWHPVFIDVLGAMPRPHLPAAGVRGEQ